MLARFAFVSLIPFILSNTVPTVGQFMFHYSSDEGCQTPSSYYMPFSGNSTCWVVSSSSSIAATAWDLNTTTLTINAYDSSNNCTGIPTSYGPIKCDNRCLKSTTSSNVFFQCFYSIPTVVQTSGKFTFSYYSDDKCSSRNAETIGFTGENKCWLSNSNALSPSSWDPINKSLALKSFNSTRNCTSEELSMGYVNCNNSCLRDNFRQGTYYTCSYSSSKFLTSLYGMLILLVLLI